MNRHLVVLFVSVFVVMLGYGVTLPVTPFYAERLAASRGIPPDRLALHIGALTATYAAMQLIFAPLWGRLSDRAGRRPLVLIGLAGFAISQALFGLATALWSLYAARALGGILSSALLPSASAYVADRTSEAERGRGMVWLNTAVALGTLVGPAFGGALTRWDVHFGSSYRHFRFDRFSIPFAVAALLALLGFLAALVLLDESAAAGARSGSQVVGDRLRRPGLALLLGAATAGYLGITLFESTVSLLTERRFQFGPGQVGMLFSVCGVAMIVVQLVGLRLAKWIGERGTVAVGFAVMSIGLLGLAGASTPSLAAIAVGFLGTGMAFIVPGLSSLISKTAPKRIGAAMGLQNAAQSVGQVGGPLLGTWLLGWNARAPYLFGAALMAVIAFLMPCRGRSSVG